jgi:hypothetical protein
MHSRPILILAAAVTSASGAEVTIHDGGKLIVKSQITTAAGGILVESGGELQVDGVANAAVDVDAGGLLNVGGDEVASVQINGGLSLDGTLRMQVSNPPGLPIQDHISGITSLAMGGTLDLQHLGGEALTAGQSFDLWDATVTTGSVPQLSGSTLPAGLFYHTWDLQTQGVLHVSYAAETYQQWAAAHGAGNSVTDLNDDGTVNLIEFALAINPAGGGNVLPTFDVEQDGSGAALALLVHLPIPSPPASIYIVEASDSVDAAAWQIVAQRTGNGAWSGTATVTSQPATNGMQSYRIVDPAPGGSSKRFMRLRVE